MIHFYSVVSCISLSIESKMMIDLYSVGDSVLGLLKVLLNRLLDLTDLVPVFSDQAHDVAPRHCHDPAPVGQNARDTANDSLQLARVNVLPVDAVL